MSWIDSGADLFRTVKPQTPPIHLVSYAVPTDDTGAILLIDHVKSGRLLPPGGHVDVDEDPGTAAVREVSEELGLTAEFGDLCGDRPGFLTWNQTVGPNSHVDVCLWYVVHVDRKMKITLDAREASAVQWVEPTDTAIWHTAKLDPGMLRFLSKVGFPLA